MSDSFRYIFRFCCDPAFNGQAEAEALVPFAREALVDDVCVFANVQELNTGHMGPDEQDVYLRLMASLSAQLKDMGLTMSVNQWHSVMHADLGKHLPDHQPFRPMVDPEGHAAALCVCPLCGEWQRYIGDLYARYAELDASILWVEDDFRLHNHDPLVWGGCFCEEHMRIYSQKAGIPLTRADFVRGVLQPGTPHPYRAIWLETARETMLSAAKAIADRVRAVNPLVKIGLMSSVPQVHAAEGRNWHALLHTLAAGQPPVCRIHLPSYQELHPGQYLVRFNAVSMLCKALIPPETLVYPELENYPYSLYAKSRRFTRFQLLSSMALRPQGMTIDLFDLNGNGIVPEDGYQAMLRAVKPFLNQMLSPQGLSGTPGGVQVLVSPLSSATLHTRQELHMEELYPRDAFWGAWLPALGIPCSYAVIEDRKLPTLPGKTVAASGQVLRNLDEVQLEQLFSAHLVLLDGEAAESLIDRGLGQLAGIHALRWIPQNNGEIAYEESLPGRLFRGRERVRASSVMSSCDVAALTYCPEAKVETYTVFCSSFRSVTCPGLTQVNDHVLIWPFGHTESVMELPPMLLSAARAELLQCALAEADAEVPMVRSSPWLTPYLFQATEEATLYLVAGATDDVDNAVITLPHGAVLSAAIASCAEYRVSQSDPHTLCVSLPSMEALAIKLKWSDMP